MDGYQQLFALTKNPKYVKMCFPKTGRPPELNNTANAGRIVRGRDGRKILPAFLLPIFVAVLAIAAIPQEKKARRNRFGADQEKKFCKKPLGRYGRKIVKGEARPRPCMPQSECGAGHTGYRIFSDPSPGGSQDTGGAFRSRVQRPGVRGCSHEQRLKTSIPQRTDLAQVKRDRHTGRPRTSTQYQGFPPAAVYQFCGDTPETALLANG